MTRIGVGTINGCGRNVDADAGAVTGFDSDADCGGQVPADLLTSRPGRRRPVEAKITAARLSPCMEEAGTDLVGAIDGIAVKPTETPIERCVQLPVQTIAVDYEGPEALPSRATLARLAADRTVRVTVPVRATGFDPLGDDTMFDRLPDAVEIVLVAGNPAYLADPARDRAIAPRLGAAIDRFPDAWIGTEGIERLATATGRAQFELLSGRTERTVRALRQAGFDPTIAVYAPMVPSASPDDILDGLGDYVARRASVAADLPAAPTTDRHATGSVRDRLLEGARKFALVGEPSAICSRIDALRAAGVDRVIAYPPGGPRTLVNRDAAE